MSVTPESQSQMPQKCERTITIRYTPASRSTVYDRLDHQLSPSDVQELVRRLNRTKISTIAPQLPKGGEVYVYRSRILGKGWRNDGYESCWRSNGSHYYPKRGSVQASKLSATFKILRHVAVDKDTNERHQFRRVAFVELQCGKENPLVVVQYFGDETKCRPVVPRLQHDATTRGKVRRRNRFRAVANAGASGHRVVSPEDCEVVQHMDIAADSSGATAATTAATADATTLDEDLREASALGDVDRVASLLASGADVNSANRVNGWTALHWAAKRNHAQVVSLLLGNGGDPQAVNATGQTPAEVAASQKVARLLGEAETPATAASTATVTATIVAAGPTTSSTPSTTSGGGFVPNYLRNPDFHYARPLPPAASAAAASTVIASRRRVSSSAAELLQQQQQQQQQKQPLLLQARVAKSRDPDFIEVELAERTYPQLLELLCLELSLEPACVERIRKLPNVRLRNDRDVARLQPGQQLELVLVDF